MLTSADGWESKILDSTVWRRATTFSASGVAASTGGSGGKTPCGSNGGAYPRGGRIVADSGAIPAGWACGTLGHAARLPEDTTGCRSGGARDWLRPGDGLSISSGRLRGGDCRGARAARAPLPGLRYSATGPRGTPVSVLSRPADSAPLDLGVSLSPSPSTSKLALPGSGATTALDTYT